MTLRPAPCPPSKHIDNCFRRTIASLLIAWITLVLLVLQPFLALAAPTKVINPAGNIAANASATTLTYSDPKTGMILWKANAKSMDAQSGQSAGDVVGTMHNVAGVLYQNGQPANSLTAPLVRADQSSRVVTASGGVILKSLTQQGTVVRCNQIVWHSDTNILVGRGNVVFRKGNFTQTGPSFQADTKLKAITMPAPQDHSAKVHATLSGK